MAEKEIKIALVDDHTLFRTGLRGLLSTREDFNVVADFGSGVEFLKHLPELDVDVVFMDPPRAGSDEAFLSSVVKLAPKKVVYVSCNPETLARDLKYLTKHGYVAGECQPVDLFPHTKHVESICLLSKKC